MITVTYHRDRNHVRIVGHAQSGEVGHDLVCASASILAYTLASFVQNMVDAKQADNPTVSLKEGDALIHCTPMKRYKASVTLVLDSICGGFDILARNYPDNISYEMK